MGINESLQTQCVSWGNLYGPALTKTYFTNRGRNRRKCYKSLNPWIHQLRPSQPQDNFKYPADCYCWSFLYGHTEIDHQNYRSWYIKFVLHILDLASTFNSVLKGLIGKFDPLYCPRKSTVHPWLMWQDASVHKGWNLPLHSRIALDQYLSLTWALKTMKYQSLVERQHNCRWNSGSIHA